MSFFHILSHLLYSFTGYNEYKTILAAYWVTEGADRCIVGRVPDTFSNFFTQLEGRVAQVDTIYAFSRNAKKLAYSTRNEGVCHAILIDKPLPGDELMDKLVYVVDSDDDSG